MAEYKCYICNKPVAEENVRWRIDIVDVGGLDSLGLGPVPSHADCHQELPYYEHPMGLLEWPATEAPDA